MLREVQAVKVTFEHEGVPTHTVALFFEKTEAQNLRRAIEKDVAAATAALGLNEMIKDVYVVPTSIHSSAAAFMVKHMGTGEKGAAAQLPQNSRSGAAPQGTA